METKLKLRLQAHRGKKVHCDFTKSGIIGHVVTGRLVDVFDNFIELADCDPGELIQLININEVNTIALIYEEDEP